MLFHRGKVEETPEIGGVLNFGAPEDPVRACRLASDALPYREQNLTLGGAVVHYIYARLDNAASCFCDCHIEV